MVRHLLAATQHSLQGLKAAWSEAAFRLECVLFLFLLPAGFWLGRSWLERAVLMGTVFVVLIVELLNTAIEAVVDLASPTWHPLAKRAKDVASAAVLLSVLLLLLVWGDRLYTRFVS